ncbi:MAG: lipopolysaccharide heptosyltransferase II [Phycisphaerae bacterium]|nr:lipopolysaccharide heptosyltransferase II [Phycisphaerae bacterium]
MPAPPDIAVILPNWVGDVVMATPALGALRRAFAHSRITLVGKQVVLDTLAGLPVAEHTLCDVSRHGRVAGGIMDLTGMLRAGRHDIAVILPNSFRSALVTKMAGIARRVGYNRDGRGWMLTDAIDPPRDETGQLTPISAIDYYVRLVALLNAMPDSRTMHLMVLPGDATAAEALLADAGADSDRPLVMLNPGASFGVSKMWDPERYAALADMLIERRGAQIIINVAPNERAIAQQVAHTMVRAPLLNFGDRDNTIAMLKALLRRCDVLVTNDTGTRHIAAALGVGVVTLFGSTDPAWAQIDYKRERVIRLDVPCSPCQQKLCSQPPGPLYHQCMSGITPEMVLPAAEELLELAAGDAEARP